MGTLCKIKETVKEHSLPNIARTFYLHIGRTLIPNQSSVEFGSEARKYYCSVSCK